MGLRTRMTTSSGIHGDRMTVVSRAEAQPLTGQSQWTVIYRGEERPADILRLRRTDLRHGIWARFLARRSTSLSIAAARYRPGGVCTHT